MSHPALRIPCKRGTALRIPCPRCGAPAGVACIPAQPGVPKNLIHQSRTQAPFWTHARVSYLKSGVRIVACVLGGLLANSIFGVIALAVGLGLAELLGIWEEVGERGE